MVQALKFSTNGQVAVVRQDTRIYVSEVRGRRVRLWVQKEFQGPSRIISGTPRVFSSGMGVIGALLAEVASDFEWLAVPLCFWGACAQRGEALESLPVGFKVPEFFE